MKHPGIVLMLLFISLTSCKKLVEDKQQNILLEIMTTGEWRVDAFLEGADSTTSQFHEYVFKFNRDGTVYGIKGTDSVPGTWVGDPANYSIQSEFPSAPEPLKKLNGTWTIKDSGLDFVAAERTTQQGMMKLQLRKDL